MPVMDVTTLTFAAAAIWRCLQPDGGVEFRGLPCDVGSRAQVLGPPTTGDVTGLSPAEQEALDALERRLAREAERAADARLRDRRRAGERRAERQRACAAAKRALAVLRERKRRGYASREGARLEAEELRLRAARDENC